MFDLSGKRALITGASSGLGAHFATLLASRGAHVTLAARRKSALTETADQIGSSGGSASIMTMDVSSEASVKDFFDAQSAPFDVVINNAGVTYDGPAMAMELNDWNRVIDTDLTGVFLVARSAANQMKSAGQGGSIVNVASILGKRVAGNVSAYAVAKAGVVQLSRSLALEWARHSIRVNTLCPGYIETDLNRDFFNSDAGKNLIRRVPQRRLGQMSDLDGAVLLLSSDSSGFMTGSELVVDGGHLVSSL